MTRGIAGAALSLAVFGVCGFLLTGCYPWAPSATFRVEVTPAEITDLAQNAPCLFLVTVTELGGSRAAEPVTLQVDASDGTVIAPATVASGEVAEVRLWGTGVAVGTTLTVTIAGERDDEFHTATATAVVTDPIESPDDRLVTGTTMRDAFIPWLAAEHPELGIDADTAWTPIPVRPHILEVSFYMFLSEDWELVVWWHVMIPPYDWTRMYLRHRSAGLAPSFGAEISSVTAGGDPHTIAPPEEVWR
jgi:hypothetical protein